jgi:hypothetical protein
MYLEKTRRIWWVCILLKGAAKQPQLNKKETYLASFGWLVASGWWLVLICYERKILLAGWWLVAGAEII